MNINIDKKDVIALFSFLGMAGSIIYGIRASRRAEKVCGLVGKTMADLEERTEIPEVSQDILESAIKNASDRVVAQRMSEVAKSVKDDYHKVFTEEAEKAVKDARDSMGDDIFEIIKDKAKNVSLISIEDRAVSKIRDDMSERLRNDVDNLYREYETNIRRIGNVCDAVTNTIKRSKF